MGKDTYIRQNRIQKKEYEQGYRGAFHNHEIDSSRGHNNSKCVFT